MCNLSTCVVRHKLKLYETKWPHLRNTQIAFLWPKCLYYCHTSQSKYKSQIWNTLYARHKYEIFENFGAMLVCMQCCVDKKLSGIAVFKDINVNYRPPEGCLQWHTGTEGRIETFNFAGNDQHLNDQQYNICIRQEMGTYTLFSFKN